MDTVFITIAHILALKPSFILKQPEIVIFRSELREYEAIYIFSKYKGNLCKSIYPEYEV